MIRRRNHTPPTALTGTFRLLETTLAASGTLPGSPGTEGRETDDCHLSINNPCLFTLYRLPISRKICIASTERNNGQPNFSDIYNH